MKTICFTGRRPKDLFGYKKESYYPLVDKMEELLLDFYQKGFDNYISGGAQGFDQISFWAVNRLKAKHLPIHNIVYVPFKGQERNWLKNGLFSQEEYQLMLQLADEIHYCSNLDITNASKFDIIQALHHRNHDMVNHSNLVFGLYPHMGWEDESTKGGTAECLRYAKEQNKEIFILSPFTLQEVKRDE